MLFAFISFLVWYYWAHFRFPICKISQMRRLSPILSSLLLSSSLHSFVLPYSSSLYADWILLWPKLTMCCANQLSGSWQRIWIHSGAPLTSLFNYHWASRTQREQESLDPDDKSSSPHPELASEKLLSWRSFKKKRTFSFFLNWSLFEVFWRRRKRTL